MDGWMDDVYTCEGSMPISIIEDLAIGVIEVLNFSDKLYDFFCLAMPLFTTLQLLNKFLALLLKKSLLFLSGHEHSGRKFRVSLSELPALLRSHSVQLLKR